MKFDCFYYPQLSESNTIVRINDNMKEFNFGDVVPTKTIYYNYGKNFAIYQAGELYIVENSILKGTMNKNEIKYPLKLVFNKGTQLTVQSPSELPSVRLLLDGENELEKELGDLFYLSLVLNRKITTTQYKVMSDLSNSCIDFMFMNQEIDRSTRDMLNELRIIEVLFYKLTEGNHNLKDSFLTYMDFAEQEDLLELAIHKYFNTDTDEYKDYQIKHAMYSSRPIYPKFKLDHMINSCNYRTS